MKNIKNTIVIVENCPVYQMALKNIIEDMGYKAVICNDGQQAIHSLDICAKKTHAILLDIYERYMPNVDGISALGHFKSKYPDVPVIAISASNDPKDEVSVRRLGVVEYIKKPVEPHTVKDSIEKVIKLLK